MKFIQKTKEQIHQENLDKLAKLRPIDDDFFRVMFRDNLPLAQFVLRILTGIKDLVLTEEITQYDIKRLAGSRSLCLDVLGTDSKGRKFDLEVQRANSGATPQRARYHSSVMDVEFLDSGKDFTELPITYTIFITENDVRGKKQPIYCYGRTELTTGEPLDDGTNIIFVNGAYNNKEDDSDIAKLMHDFRCDNADDMYFDIMADRTRYFKENAEGASSMCKIIEDRAKEMADYKAVEIAYNFLKAGVAEEVVAESCNFSLEDVRELAEQIRSEKT